MKQQPQMNDALFVAHVTPIADELREQTERLLRDFYPFKYGPVLDQALARAYQAGLRDGFVQGATAAGSSS